MTRRVTEPKTPKIEFIYVLSGTQVEGSPKLLGRGCYLPPRTVWEIGKKYQSQEKTRGGKSVDFVISEAKAAKLIDENQAVPCTPDDSAPDGYRAVNIFGDDIEDDIQIIVDKPAKKKKAADPGA